jgi:NAD(P)-dependent dehydrogenase (short-subunit alcohol dehydrogenase family)
MPMKTWKDMQALVTGAASGIGRALALELARKGARVALVDIDRAGLASALGEVRRLAPDVEASAHVTDLADPEAVDALAKAALAELGHVDLLVNNAGVAVVSPLVQMTTSDWSLVTGVNVWGPIRLTQALLPSMLARKSGRIVMTASLAGLVGAPGMVAYSTTKFAIVGFTEALRHEVEGQGVGVTLVCPGYVRTGFHAATRYKNDGFEQFLDRAPRWYGLSAERVAAIVLDAVARGQSLVTIGPEKAGWLLKRLSPELGFWVTRWVAERTGILRAGAAR